jgi:muconolactone delta-isomerase
MGKREGSEFIVKLDGIKLPAAVEAQIAKEIQAVVLREVARVDMRGDLLTRIPFKEWLGIWIRPQEFDRNAVFSVNERS